MSEVSASGAINPDRGSVAVVFFFPNRHARFGLIDKITAGIKRRPPVRGGHADPHRELADFEGTHAVHADGATDREPLPGFRQDSQPFFFREGCVRFVIKRDHRLAFIMVTHPAFKRHACARVCI